jgi:hypothetical protein
LIIEAQSLAGHKIGSDVLHWVTVSDFLPSFSLSKVIEMIETQSAKFTAADVWLRVSPPLMKTMLQRQSCANGPFSKLEMQHDR